MSNIPNLFLLFLLLRISLAQFADNPFPVPPSSNCVPLSDNIQLRWKISDVNSISISIVAKLFVDQYIAFGPSGSDQASTFLNSDLVVISRFSDNRFSAIDFFVSSQSECSQSAGFCPDTSFIPPGGNDTFQVAPTRIGDFVQISYSRPLLPSDQYDKRISFDSPTFVYWLRGSINPNTQLPSSDTDDFIVRDTSIDFPRVTRNDCDGDAVIEDIELGPSPSTPFVIDPSPLPTEEVLIPSPDITQAPTETIPEPSVGPTFDSSPIPTATLDPEPRCTTTFAGEEREYDGCQLDVISEANVTLDVYWTLREEEGEIDTFLRARPGNGYFAFGWDSQRMVRSSAVVVMNIEDELIIDDYFLASRTSQGVQPNGTQELTNARVERDGDNILCIFTRKLSINNVQRTISRGPTSAIWAFGPAPSSPTDLAQHSERGIVSIDLSTRPKPEVPTVAPAESPAESPTEASDGCEVTFNNASREFDRCDKSVGGGVEVYWSFVGEDEIVTLFRAPTKGGYVGFGWGYSAMVGAKTMIAFARGDQAEISGYDLMSKSTEGVQPSDFGFDDVEAAVDGDFVGGRFRRKLEVERLVTIVRGSNDLIWATGEIPTSRTNLQRHDSRGRKIIDLTTGQSTIVKSTTVGCGTGRDTRFFVIHGSLLATAWLGLVPIAILIMRFGKSWNPLSFNIHRGLNTISALITIAAVAMGLSRGCHTEKGHMTIGLIVLIGVLIQVTGGIFRVRDPGSKRTVWRRIHQLCGASIWILGMVNIWLGLEAIDAKRGYYAGAGVAMVAMAFLFVGLSFCGDRLPVNVRKAEIGDGEDEDISLMYDDNDVLRKELERVLGVDEL